MAKVYERKHRKKIKNKKFVKEEDGKAETLVVIESAGFLIHGKM